MSQAIAERSDDRFDLSAFLRQVATDDRIDPAKMQALWTLRKDILEEERKERADNARVAFFAALADVQGKLPVIRRDRANPNTSSRFAQFSTIWAECSPIWTRYGFSVSFDSSSSENDLIDVSLILSHRNGHREVFHAPRAPSDRTGARGNINKTFVQGNQSTITYLQRGLLCRAFGIVTADFEDDDDDGQGGQAPGDVTHRRGRDMPPVGRNDPYPQRGDSSESRDSRVPDSVPSGSMRETAQELESKRRENYLATLTQRLDGAESAAEVNAILARDSVKKARADWPLGDRQLIEKEIARTYDRLARIFEHPTAAEIAAAIGDSPPDELTEEAQP